jgi:hypothetical protein
MVCMFLILSEKVYIYWHMLVALLITFLDGFGFGAIYSFTLPTDLLIPGITCVCCFFARLQSD